MGAVRYTWTPIVPPPQTPAERAREQYEAQRRVGRKRAIRRALAELGVTDVVVR